MTETKRADCNLGHLRRPLRPRGFTLIELMIVVVIIGVLSSLGIYSVLEYIRYAKTAEPREIVASIKAGEHAFNDEVGRYLDATGGLTDDDFYPAKGGSFDGDIAVQWGDADACEGENSVPCITHFNTMGVVVDSAVIFRYAATTVDAGVEIPDGGRAPAFNPNAITAPGPSFVVQACAHLRGTGSGMTVIASWSGNAEIFVDTSRD